MADMAKTLEDPAMADTLHRMMQDMRPEDMASMMRQMGMGDMSTEQASGSDVTAYTQSNTASAARFNLCCSR